jgi:hypothetical protein
MNKCFRGLEESFGSILSDADHNKRINVRDYVPNLVGLSFDLRLVLVYIIPAKKIL